MLTPDDRREIDEQIVAKLDAESIVSIFTSMDERQKEELAQSLSRFMVDRAQALRKPENYYTPQWRKQDQDINYTSPTEFYQANVAGHAGPTLPRALNLQGANWEAWLSANNPEELNLRVRGGGGADCMFNYLVSSCWATEVANSRGVEGQSVTSVSGCTFKVFSTVQGALTQWNTDNVTGVIFVCPGTYTESLTWANANNKGCSIIGAGVHATKIAALTASTALIEIAHGTAATRPNRTIKNLTLDGTTQSGVTIIDITGTAVGITLRIDDVWFLVGTNGVGYEPAVSGSYEYPAVLTNVEFHGSDAAGAKAIHTPASGGTRQNFIVDGFRIRGSFQYGISLYNNKFFMFRNGFISGGDTAGIFFTAAGCTDGEFDNIFFEEMVAAGIKFNASAGWGEDRLMFRNIHMQDVITFGFDSSGIGNDAGLEHVVIENFSMQTVTAAAVGIKGETVAGRQKYCTVRNGKFQGFTAGNELVEWANTGNKAYHLETDSGTEIADVGTPTGHSGLAAGTLAAPAHEHIVHAVLDSTVVSTTVPYVGVGPMARAGSIVAGGIEIRAGSKKVCGATACLVDIHKILLADLNTDTDTTIYTTQGNRPTLTDTQRHAVATDPDVTAFAAGDWFNVYLDQAGTDLTDVSISMEVSYT